MRFFKVFLENFRGFYGTVEITIDNFTVFIGKNDQGKTTILEAIDLFINEGKGIIKVDENDLNLRAKNEGKDSFKIGIVFKDIPSHLEMELQEKSLLNSEGYLEIWKTFKNKKLSRTVLKHKNLQGGIEETDIKDEKDIWEKIQVYIPVYTLFHSDRKNTDQDDEIQDPLKSKIEEIFSRDTIREKLNEIARAINEEIENISNRIVEKFKELNKNSIEIKIIPNIPSIENLKWKDVYKAVGFLTNENIPLNKRGSGVRRLVLLSSFMTELERTSNTDDYNHIIYAIEEPETSLHPDLQIKLINTLQQLSEGPKYQILISTHSPALIKLFSTKSIRYVEQEDGCSKVKVWDDSIADKIVKELGLLHHIGKVIICVEGTNDERFLLNINKNIEDLKNIINLEEKIQSGIISIIPLKGSNLIDWINRYVLKNTNAVEFHLYDKDKNEQYKEQVEKVNRRNDGSFACLTNKREIENYVPQRIIEEEFEIQLDNIDLSNWDNEDIPRKIIEKGVNMAEKDIKEKLCCSCSKKITKEDLEGIKAWEEVKGWFEKIKELTDKVLQS